MANTPPTNYSDSSDSDKPSTDHSTDSDDPLEVEESEWEGIIDEPTLLPPPDGYHKTYKALMESANAHGMQQGFAIVQDRSLKTLRGKGVHYKSYLCCDRGGRTRKSRGSGVRNTKSRWKDYPFSAIAKHIAELDLWRLSICHEQHNHGPCRRPIAHPAHRKRTQELRERVVSMARSGVEPRKILSTLRDEDKGLLITTNDIYNIKRDAR
jgi:hypothetical protein